MPRARNRIEDEVPMMVHENINLESGVGQDATTERPVEEDNIKEHKRISSFGKTAKTSRSYRHVKGGKK